MTLSRDEDSSLRHWSSRLIQALQILDLEVDHEKIVQVDQELKFVQPIKEGDKLYCDVWVHSIRQSFGADIIVTKNIVTNDKGEIVQETYTTLAGRSDGEGSGFNDGTA